MPSRLKESLLFSVPRLIFLRETEKEEILWMVGTVDTRRRLLSISDEYEWNKTTVFVFRDFGMATMGHEEGSGKN